MQSLSLKVRVVETEQEFAAMLYQRWRVLRAPLGMAQGTERDCYDDGYDHDSVTHLIALHQGSTLTQSDKPIIGSARLRKLPSGVGSIAYVAVSSEFQRQGIGSALVQHLIELAKEQSFSQLRVMARTAAIRFYQQFGFIARGEPINHLDAPHIFMYLDLST